LFITKLLRHSTQTGKNSTIIAIMSALGRDCTADFEEVHHGIAMWPTIKAQLESYYIGRVKPPYKADGDTKKNTLELIKETTLLMERTKPSHLLFNVLQSLAKNWNLHAIVGVSDNDHAFAGYTRTLAKRVKLNYDQIWQELGGEKNEQSGHWVLPRNWAPRPIEEIESKKRAAYRRRCALRLAFIDACARGGPHLLAEEETV
jgi:uncharacterized protein VirK/YbjX